MDITSVIFVLTLVFGLSFLLGLMITIFSSKTQIWPPLEDNPIIFWGYSIIDVLFFIGLIYLNITENKQANFLLIRIVSATFLGIFGLIFVLWGMRNINIKQMFGLKGNLIVQGPFRFSRNPEYLGFISLLISGLIISGSIYVFIVNLTGIVWFLLAPLTEEKWLYEQFGESYARYCKKVPRFFSLKPRKVKN